MGGVCLSACWDTTPLKSRQLPRADTPPRADHPKSRNPPPHPGRGEMATAADGTHPTGMHSCFFSFGHVGTSGCSKVPRELKFRKFWYALVMFPSKQLLRARFRFRTLFWTKFIVRKPCLDQQQMQRSPSELFVCVNSEKQECIPVGCVPQAR